jgi:hypothetical protein
MTNAQSIFLSITAVIGFVGTLAPLVWAAIQDGRYEAAQHAA